MTTLDTIDTAWREDEILGDPGSGKYKPLKAPQRRVLKRMEALAAAGVVHKATAALLNAITPPTENYGGAVYNDPDPTKNGHYVRSSGVWVWSRGFPDSFARVELSGTANAQIGTLDAGVNPADIGVFFAIVTTPNTGPMTASIAGVTRDVVNFAGNALTAGEWANIVQFILNDDGDFQLIIDAASADAAAQSATLAGTEADRAEDAAAAAANQVAAVIPSLQRFAVGGVVQSADLGDVELHPNAVRVFIEGVYQFSDTWDLTAGVLTPVAGTWPGNGVTENMEVIIDATSAVVYNVPSNGSVTRQKIAAEAVGEDELDPAVLALIEGGGAGVFSTDLPFGRAGLRVLRGEKYDAHYGLPSGWMVFPSGKWTLIYRRASGHAITDGAVIRAADSYDQGATLVNDRVIYTDPTHDARPDSPRLFANGRSGFMVNRQDEGSTHFSPLLIYSDDEFVTFSQKTLTLPSPYTFASNGGIMDFPLSQGGHDTLGFIAFGFVGAGSYGRISTADNWDTYTVSTGVAALSHTPATGTAITTLSEWAGARIGNQDKWIFYLRCQDAGGWRDEAACFVTTNMLDWGDAVPSNISLGGNPPCCFFDNESNKFHFIAFGRGGRGIDSYDHHMLIVSADGDDLWDAEGNWAALGLTWSVVTPVPNWATGYMSPVHTGDSWMATFVCGEPGSAGGDRSILAMIGDFVPSTTDVVKLAEAFRWNAIFKAVRAGLSVATSPPADAYFVAGVDSASAGFLAYNAGSALREFYAVWNSNGNVGGIDASGTATVFRTSSDGRIKVLRNGVEEEIDLDAVWAAVEPLFYTMLSGVTLEELPGRYVGMIAQDLHQVFPWAVVPGSGEPGEPGFRPWGIDYSKLVPLIVARQKQFERRTNDRLVALEGGE